jgi:hypothetical protein
VDDAVGPLAADGPGLGGVGQIRRVQQRLEHNLPIVSIGRESEVK